VNKMIKIRNLHKYFNKNKANEIHVIDETNLDFPKTGLVCLLGPSGSGKTTLLNVVGGLDKVNSGEIIFDDITLKRYNANKWDNIRNHHFGYIFQNYILLPDLSVYENLEFVLKMLDLKPEEINERIDYALEAVGMVKYKKRKPGQLSGGQQQRIAIARALVKSPDVVIADEPTGNLDEKNTTQIMNIIKKISKECLVILVTHERRLAEFYSDNIIELLDGKIVSQNEITGTGDELYHLDDHNIYLQDYSQDELSNQDLNVKYFYQDNKPSVELNIIFKDNTFYINSSKDNVKIKLIDNDNEIKVIDSKKPVIRKENFEEFEYHLPKIDKEYKKSRSVIKYKDTFKMSFNHLSGLRRRQKLLLLVLFLSSIMVVIGFTNLISSTHIDEKEFLTDNRNLVEVKGVTDYNKLLELKEILDTEHILGAANSIFLNDLKFDIYRQTKNYPLRIPEHSLMPITVVEDPIMFLGRLPSAKGEVVIDKWIADKMLEDSLYISAGLKFYDQLIGLEYFTYPITSGTIVGIIDTNNPNIYMNLNEYQLKMIGGNQSDNIYTDTSLTSITEYYDYDDYLEELTNDVPAEAIDFSNLNLIENQILVSKAYFNNISASSNKIILEGIEYTVVGIFQSISIENVILSPYGLEQLYYSSITNNYKAAISLYSLDKNATILKLEQLELIGKDIYDQQYEQYKSYTFSIVQYTFSIIILLASLIFLYFIMRSSLISRVYEVGVYRALGVKKSNVYRLFTSEIILVTLFTSVVGVFMVAFLINEVNRISPIELIYFPWYVSIVSITFLFACNLLVGLIPITNLLRLTPSQILSKYDI